MCRKTPPKVSIAPCTGLHHANPNLTCLLLHLGTQAASPHYQGASPQCYRLPRATHTPTHPVRSSPIHPCRTLPCSCGEMQGFSRISPTDLLYCISGFPSPDWQRLSHTPLIAGPTTGLAAALCDIKAEGLLDGVSKILRSWLQGAGAIAQQ